MKETVEQIKARKYEGLYTDEDYNASCCDERVRETKKEKTFMMEGVSFTDVFRQCRSKPGHGIGSLFCKRHAPDNS